ncbi:MAG: molybdopterin cofactor-binding domain-containing protein [Pleomorphochaeta sp.]
MGKKKFSLNNKSSLQGFLVKATDGIFKNPQFKLPTIPNDCLVLFPKDIIGSNILEIQKQSIPLLASSYISYIGQPLYAVFAPTLEKAEQIAREISIEYLPVDNIDNKAILEDQTSSFEAGRYAKELDKIIEENSLIIQQNEEEKEEKKEALEIKYKAFKSKLKFERIKYFSNQTTCISVEINDDTLNIYAPTQWPALIVNSVSNICGFNKKKIIVNKEQTYSNKDEMLIQPAILASFAALAAVKSNKNIFIHENIEMFRPEVLIERETWYRVNDKKTILEEIKVTIDQGAFSLFSKEISKQYIAGLVPLYDLKAIKINFDFIQSPVSPTNFFGGLGYENAIASTQTHTTKLGKSLGLSPFFWTTKSLFESALHKKVMEINSLQEPKECLQDLVDRSFFNRKYAAYKVNSALDKHFSTFTPYARGIGLAIAPSISGFSTNNSTFGYPKVKLTLNFDSKVELNTSFYNASKASNIWKEIISQELDIKKKNITFCTDSTELVDSGPCTLSTNSKIMSEQVKLACKKINDKRFIEGLPISVSVARNKRPIKGPLFSSESWIALIIEAGIDPITLKPVVFKVSANCSVGDILDEVAYINNLREEILDCIFELGAKTTNGEDFNIDIKINQKSDNISDSITSGLRGAVFAAFNTALEMALNFDNDSLPTSSEKILTKIGDSL